MKAYIVSELGVNHGGSVKVAEEMVKASRECGVDAVKLQYYVVEDLELSEDVRERVAEAQLGLEELVRVRNFAVDHGLDCLITPMAKVGRVDEAVSVGFSLIKVRERDSRDEGFVKHCIGNPDVKSVIVSSTRMSLDPYILYHPKVKWVYTVPKYPATVGDVEWNRLGLFDGYSNHVPKVSVPVAAFGVARSAGVRWWYVELHFTLDHSRRDIDDCVSFDPEELSLIVRLIREMEG